MDHLKSAFPFVAVILAGLAIFLLDYFEFSSISVREYILAPIALFKSGFFLRFLLTHLRQSADEEDFYFHDFARFVALSMFLVVLSFALDYYCLFRINPASFHGASESWSIPAGLMSFFYFSVSTFTTAGFGDIAPDTTIAKAFVTLQLCIGWLCTIMVIGNLAHLRESISRSKE